MHQAVGLEQIQRGDHLGLRCAESRTVIASSVRLALDPWRRLRGLIGGRPLAAAEALLLLPCNGVHMLFMRYAIDVVFIDQAGRVRSVHPSLRPWRATGLVAGARAAIELPAGRAAACGVSPGQLVTFERQ